MVNRTYITILRTPRRRAAMTIYLRSFLRTDRMCQQLTTQGATNIIPPISKVDSFA